MISYTPEAPPIRSTILPSTCPAASRSWALAGRDRDLEPCGLHSAVEPLKLADADDALIGSHAQAASLPRRGLDTVRVRHPAACSHEVEDGLLSRATREDESCVEATRREGARGLLDVAVLSVDGHVGTQSKREGHAIGARGRREHACSAQLRELDGERADAAGRAMNDHGLAPLELERVVDSLKRGEPRYHRPGVLEVESLGQVRDSLGRDGDVFRVEA
jgi:hypothetical protein